MRRPAWAETAAFANCWAHLEMVEKLGATYPRNCLKALQDARVVKINRDQLDVLPLDLDRLATDGERNLLDYRKLEARWRETRLPFPVTLLDLSEAQVPMFLNETLATAALAIGPESIERLGFEFETPPISPVIIPFLRYPEGRPGEPIGVAVTPSPIGEGIIGLDLADWETFGRDKFANVLRDGIALSERAIASLNWLMSFNVELLEAPLSPRRRTHEIKKGRQIALVIQVKESRRQATAPSSGASANFAYRFETRGHYRHHFKLKADGTPSKTFARCLSKDPSRLIQIDGKPCFRFWVPAHIKGPKDKPLVPKIRVAGKSP